MELLRRNLCRSFKNANGVIFLSNYSVNAVSRTCKGIKEYKIIPHGVSDSFKTPHKSIEKKNGHKHLLYVSIIDLYKHQWQVVRAFHKLIDSGYDLKLSLLGPSYLPALKKVHKAIRERPELQSRIIIKEKVPYDKLPQIYNEGDIFVFASSCESFGMIVLEAMATGIPITCSNLSSMKETLGDSGIYFNPNDVNDIYTAIKRFLDNPGLSKKMSDKAIKRSLNYSWNDCADQSFSYLNEVYESSI